MKPVFSALAACMALLWTGPLVLDGSTAQAQTADSSRVITLPALDVLASRSLIPPSRLPFSITTTTPSPGSIAGATAADAALRGIPGVQVANRFNDAIGERITIRGMGARAQFGVRGIRVVLDGVPATMPDGQTTLTQLDAAAVTSTQVLRGPAGAIWGNATGGVIELRTSPLSSHFANVRFDHGSFDLMRVSIAGAIAPADASTLYGRITSHEYRGFRPNGSSHKVMASAGGELRTKRGRVWFASHAVDYEAGNPGSLSQAQLDSARFQANPNNVRQKTGEDGTHADVGLGWSRAFGLASFELTGWGVLRDLNNPIPPTIIDVTRKAGGARAVLSSPMTSRLIIMGGVEAGVQADDRENHVNALGTRGALTLDQAENVRYVAPFAQALYAVTPRIDAHAALRYDSYRFKARDRLVSASDPDDSGSRSMDAPSVTVGARMRAGWASFFGNYATSFQTPTTTELANRPDGAGGFNPALDPERTRGGEVGVSVERAGVRINAAAFASHVRHALIAFEVPTAPGRQYFRNAGSVKNRGVELAGGARVVKSVDVSASFAHVDSRFDEYTAAGVQYDGNQVPGVARYTADAAVTWTVSRGAALAVSARHGGRMIANDANTATAPGHTVFDAAASLPAVPAPFPREWDVKLKLSAGVSNVTDVAYITAVSINAAGSRYFEPGPGRAVFVSVTAGR